MSKFNNRTVQVDGFWFDSGAEARRYQELKLLEQAGEISALRLHPRYAVIPGFVTHEGKKERATGYEADFEYIRGDQIIVEDVKGYPTPAWKLKWKLAQVNYPDRVWKVVKA
jgi:hypothetical protein